MKSKGTTRARQSMISSVSCHSVSGDLDQDIDHSQEYGRDGVGGRIPSLHLFLIHFSTLPRLSNGGSQYHSRDLRRLTPSLRREVRPLSSGFFLSLDSPVDSPFVRVKRLILTVHVSWRHRGRGNSHVYPSLTSLSLSI